MTQRARTFLEFAFHCSLSSGLHGRPASQLVEVASTFACECVLTNLRNGMMADLKSVLAIIAADVRQGDECTIQVRGADEQAAHTALRNFVDKILPDCDTSAPSPASRSQGVAPRVLQAAGVRFCCGTPVSHGIACGKVVVIGPLSRPQESHLQPAGDPQAELERIRRAIDAVRDHIRTKLNAAKNATETTILKAELTIVSDPSLTEKLAHAVSQGKSAGQAVLETAEFFASILRHSDSEQVRERGLDVEEICLQLLDEIYGTERQLNAVALEEPSVVVTETLGPQQLLALDRRWCKALIVEHSGSTSHAVILARSLAIPTLVGVKGARRTLTPGETVVVDANRGLVVPQSSEVVQRFYERELRTLQRRREALNGQLAAPATTTDGKVLEVAANASLRDEWALAFENGADGIGLFRTEMIFLQRDHPPSEDEQFAIYTEAVRAAEGRPVILRTLDLGGDKSTPYLNLPEEENPFLGYRGIRMYADHQEMVRAQLRAILRASAFGRVQIMAPMISSLEEVVQFKSDLARARQELREKGIAVATHIPIGVMIEVPSAAFILNQLCAEVDFFSIGTNDLNQYFLAVDRDNPKIADLSNVRHPGFLRFLKQIVDDIHRAGKWVGMCGEMAADIRNLPLMAGLELDEISLAPTDIAEFKRTISQLSAARCAQLLHKAIACRTTAELDAVLERERPAGPPQPLLSADMIVVESDSRTKEEAIQEIVDTFYVAGRTSDRQQLEEALWVRESVYSTDFGNGFAVPHCKTNAVTVPSIGVLKLKQPVLWGSDGAEPVHTMIVMAMRESEAVTRHMEVFSMLARKLVNDDFRNSLRATDDRQKIVAYLAQQLDYSAHSTVA
jgi:fructose-specific PTS system IIA-like component